MGKEKEKGEREEERWRKREGQWGKGKKTKENKDYWEKGIRTTGKRGKGTRVTA